MKRTAVRAAILNDIERVPCALCGQSDAATFIQGCGPRQIVRCRRDGLVYVSPRLPATHIVESFGTFVTDENQDLFESQRGRTLRREAGQIKALKRGGSLLDVGCATGPFFANFPEPSWRLFGVEPCRQGADYARRRYQADVFQGVLRDAHWPEEFFDVVTILDSLFYFPNPLVELMEARRVLKRDGVLALEIPGFTYKLLRERGPLCWLFDRKWSRLKPESMHLYHFSPRTLRLLLEKAGYRVVKAFPQQAPLGRSKAADALNHIHFGISRLLWWLTGGRCSIAAKEFYICRKLDPVAERA